ncbi:MAG: sigma-70 family RNA polymerase sigma factor [Deltaproteobacteria bacterium]|nr:sigma-70 family RNA polymerase sigma factor [Deltaproteobacteria bacterium]
MIISKQFTNRESKSLDQYLQEIGRVDLITPAEEIDLAIKIKKGDKLAQEKLIKANLRFVVSVAKHFQNKGLSLGDLINEGNIGLIKAAQRFDETRGFKFISYAVWWIRQGIMSAIADHQRVVRLPLNRVNNLTKISKAYRDLEQEYERKPTAEELAKILEMTAEEVAVALQISARYVSIDAPLKSGDENKNSLMDLLPNDNQPLPDNGLMKESLKNEVTNILSTLDAREAEVIRLSFGIGRNQKATLEEIGDRCNLTRARIRPIKENAFRKLSVCKRSDKLKAYL